MWADETTRPGRPTTGAGSYESAIEEACLRAEQWYRTLPEFRNQVNLGNVVGFKHPALVSEHDCVIHFARFLNEAGVPWEAMNHELSVSRWLFDNEHPAATARKEAALGEKRWRVDLALRDTEEFRNAPLPIETEPGFQFDAFLEFKYLKNYWTLPKARSFGDPEEGRANVQRDVEKIARYLDRYHACRAGYMIVFEECDWGFTPESIKEMERSGCRVRFVRSYSPPCPDCGAQESGLPIVWGMPSPELERQAEVGELVLGGCLIEGDNLDPEWECRNCKHCWRG
jgi:hypothetical protein